MPSGFEVSLTIPELPATLTAFQAQPALRTIMINEALIDCGHILVRAVKTETPIGKSPRGKATHGGGKALAASTNWRIVTTSGDQQLIISQPAHTWKGVSYGVFVREGTKPHEIVPAEAKSLHFFIGGKEIFTKHVHHPGTKANPYHIRALDRVRGELDTIVNGINEKTAANIATAGSK